jgi:hypothetical protein
MSLWDIAGDPSCGALRNGYYIDASKAIIVVSTLNFKSQS